MLRDHAWIDLPARELVPGDLVEVRSGGAFPADGLVLAGDNLQVDESMLSGESLPVRKLPLAGEGIDEMSAVAPQWVAAGTQLLTGQARVRVAFTGRETLYGEIVHLVVQERRARTPLQVAIGRLVAVLLVVAVLMCLILAAIRLYQGHGIIDALLSAVTLAVAALPEEFPVVFTFFLGAGAYRLARRQALVRRAVAVENIGRITCICSDKTGTMTEGRLVLAQADPAPGMDVVRLAELAALACRPDAGDPLDDAILGLANAALREGARRTALYPFTEARRYETATWRLASGEQLAVVKGAPETVLARCGIGDDARAAWLARVSDHASRGNKVIGCAMRRLDATTAEGDEPAGGFQFCGLLAFGDPLREGVRDAVRGCMEAGIRVIMVTGDHPGTARAIAAQAGLGDGQPNVVGMDDLEVSLQDVGDAALQGVDVVARAVPAQKLNLVRLLQKQGEIVAVTGDGVNDAPALQAADIGIAMGGRGSRSAREVASIVLLDDNFRTIVRAIAEGRQLFRNLQLSFAYLLMVHIPLVLTAAIIPLAGYPLLYLPIHIVWIELVIHPTALLVFQDSPPTTRMAPVTRDPRRAFFGPGSWAVIALVGMAVAAATLLGYRFADSAGKDPEHARTIALVTLLMANATLTAALSKLKSWAAGIIVVSGVLSLALLVQVEALARLIHLHPLRPGDWVVAAGAGVVTGMLGVLFHTRPGAGRHAAALESAPRIKRS